MTTQANPDASTHTVVRDERVKERNRLQRLMIRPEVGAAIGAILIFVLFLVVAEPFREASSLATVLYASSTIGIMACGVAMLMIGGEFDLSTGVAVTFSSLAASMLAYNLHLNLWAGAALALVLALGVGFFNGFLVMKTRIPSFLITLSTFFMLAGINLAVTKLVAGQVATQSVSDMQGWDSAQKVFASSFTIGNVSIRITVVWWLVFTAIATYVLFKTKIGNWIFAVGGDAEAARAVGVPVTKVKIGLFMFVGFCAWFVGMHLLFAFNTVQSGQGVGNEFFYIIAAVIGGCLLTGGYGTAIGAAIGASYGGALGITSTSGPGVSLKSEAIGLAVMTELPLIVIDVQRGGPSTGLPTKTEQADLLQAMFGRNGESPVAVLAPRSPSDCFETAIEAARIAITYHTPVMILSDGAIANGSEPWRIPDVSSYAPIEHTFAKEGEPFQPYARDPETLARQFAIPGTPGLEHRIGGLESANGSGNISYEPKNHDLMVRLRHAKVAGIEVPDLEVDDPTGDAALLLLGWGSSYGPIGEACRRARRKGIKVAHAQLRNLNPFPANLGEVLGRYSHVVVPEMNLGQLALLLRGKYLIDIQSVTKVEGMAFLADEVEGIIDSALDGTLGDKELEKTKFARLAAATVDGAVGANS